MNSERRGINVTESQLGYVSDGAGLEMDKPRPTQHAAVISILSATTLLDFEIIVAGWLLLIVTMLTLQQLGYDYGFHVWPIGEVRNWLLFLQEGSGADAAKLFWSVDNRNALAPWWYLAARRFIEQQPSAFLILHLVMA